MDKKTPPTIAEIIQGAALELDGIGLDNALIDEATEECAKELEKVAARALRKVLVKRIEVLAPPTRPKKLARAKPSSADDPA